MADAKHLLQLFERGVGVFFDVRLEFLGVELAPMSPALFRSQRTFFGGVQIPINGTPSYCKLPGGLGFGATALNEFNHPFPQVVSRLLIPNIGDDPSLWWKLSSVITCGTLAGAIIPEFVKIFTSVNSGHVKEVVTSAREGGASLNILSGLVD